jgi:uncharacterized FlaG/YvyC family protein
VITEGISNNGIQLVRRGDASLRETSSYASPGEAVNNLKLDQGKPASPGSLEATDRVEISEEKRAEPTKAEENASEKSAGMSSEAQKNAETVIKDMVNEMNQKFDRTGLRIRFGTDQESGLDYFQLYNKKNGDVVKQYPPEAMLDMVANLKYGWRYSQQKCITKAVIAPFN